jgi:hypothetical protein
MGRNKPAKIRNGRDVTRLLEKEGCEIRMGNSLPCPFHVRIAAFLESFWKG